MFFSETKVGIHVTTTVGIYCLMHCFADVGLVRVPPMWMSFICFVSCECKQLFKVNIFETKFGCSFINYIIIKC